MKLDINAFEEALEIIRSGKDRNGNSYNELGRLNQAAWIGEHAGELLNEIARLKTALRERGLEGV